MKYWSEVDGAWFEGESVWNGRDPIPGVGFGERRGSYLVQAQNRGADTTHEPVAKKFQRSRCACGALLRLMPGSRQTQCKACRTAAERAA